MPDVIPPVEEGHVPVVEEGRYSKEEVKRAHAIEVPKEILDAANYMSWYEEKVIQWMRG